MGVRYGEGFAGETQAAAYGETIDMGDVRVTFCPAGHVLGSAQILIETKPDGGGRTLRIVASGDYKRAADPTCARFNPMSCDVFITEATFGLPVFRHPDAASEIDKLMQSVKLFPERTHIVGAYALGKAQRLIALLRAAGYDAPIYLHGAMERLTQFYVECGVELGDVRKVEPSSRGKLGGAIVICPPSATQDLVGAPFRRSGHLVRIGLDAGEGAGTPARG